MAKKKKRRPQVYKSLEEFGQNEGVTHQSINKEELLVWCTNPDDYKDQLRFTSRRISQLGLDYDTFFNKKNGRWVIKKSFKDLFANIHKSNIYIATYWTNQNKHFITSLKPMEFRLPLDSRKLMEKNENGLDNYALWLNKAGPWHKDKFQYVIDSQPTRPFEDDKVIELRKAVMKRQSESADRLNLQLEKLDMQASWRLTIGLGNASIYETGLTLHPLYGFPYISASGIKGIVRSWIITEVFDKSEEKAMKDDFFCYLFGCDERSRDKIARKGNITFFDAFPAGKITIEPDVMTPHYSEYYTDLRNKTPPADYLSPKPIFFLTVKKTTFQFCFGLLKKAKKQRLSDFEESDLIKKSSARLDINQETSVLDFVKYWLADALYYHGAGAKTAIGYGRMEYSKS